MTAPLNLEGVYPRRNQQTGKPSMERFLKKLFTKCVAAVLFLATALILYMIFSLLTFPPPPTIQEITPAERKQVSDLSKKYKLTAYVWAIDRKSGEISYYRKGEWRVIQ